MTRPLQHQLHGRLELAAQVLDLPLTADQLERLALELAPAVRAMLAEQADSLTAQVPVTYAVVGTDVDRQAGVAITTWAQCTSAIGTDVDHESPAALLAHELRSRQPDVIGTDVPTGTYLGLTVRPQSLSAWRWWLDRLSIAAEAVTVQDTDAYAVGVVGDIAVQLCGQGVAELLADRPVARLMGMLAESDTATP
ncbi:hypothetical protein ABZZ79_03455 [Streptomyces sp. NPDC006458]|uniref:hypothetical protein n=1 Tax=Streptomyces sp. NPDC006458 TaxID=3154302 RepID=UPI00339F2F6E